MAWVTEFTLRLIGTGSPILSMASLNSSLSSDMAMASGWVPTSSQPSLASEPLSYSSEHMFSAVCPPIPDRTPSTPSFSIMAATVSAFSGSMYTLSAMSVSVWMVAGLEFTSTVLYPSARRARHAWEPEKSNSAACPITMGPEPMTISFLKSFLTASPPS